MNHLWDGSPLSISVRGISFMVYQLDPQGVVLGFSLMLGGLASQRLN